MAGRLLQGRGHKKAGRHTALTRISQLDVARIRSDRQLVHPNRDFSYRLRSDTLRTATVFDWHPGLWIQWLFGAAIAGNSNRGCHVDCITRCYRKELPAHSSPGGW